MFDHENLMKIEGVYETDNSIYLVTELLGKPLYDEIKLANFEKRRKIIKNIVKGIIELNKKGIMHRDLKPENILFKPKTSNIAIADFGLAQKIKEKFLFVKCGTYGYVAP